MFSIYQIRTLTPSTAPDDRFLHVIIPRLKKYFGVTFREKAFLMAFLGQFGRVGHIFEGIGAKLTD